ncbi:MAG: ribonuclease P protein component [Actinomycetota bacterium]
MIGRIGSRDDFRRLSRAGRRVRIDPLWCSYLLDAQLDRPHVAFAIGRQVGVAVKRNRLRRRLRASLTSADLPPGLFLFGARPGSTELTFDEISARVRLVERRMADRHAPAGSVTA